MLWLRQMHKQLGRSILRLRNRGVGLSLIQTPLNSIISRSVLTTNPQLKMWQGQPKISNKRIRHVGVVMLPA